MLEAPRTIAMIRSEDVALDGRPLSPLDIGSSETPGYRDRPDWSWTRYRKLWTLIIRRGIEDAGTRADCRRLVSRAFRDSRQRARPVGGRVCGRGRDFVTKSDIQAGRRNQTAGMGTTS